MGTYIIEGNLAYIEQEEEGKVTVATVEGIRETVHINELEKFTKMHDMDNDIKRRVRYIDIYYIKEIEKGSVIYGRMSM